MKKLIISIFAISLALMLALVGTGCSFATNLTFNYNFTDGVKPTEINTSTAYNETLTYTVERVDEYEAIKTSNSITSPIPTYEYGIMTVTFRTNVPSSIDLSGSDINQLEDFNSSNIFYIKTLFEIEVDGKYNDTIISECCFYQANLSFAPIWSKSIVRNTYFDLSGTESKAIQNIYIYETLYNSTSYTMKKYQYMKSDSENLNLIQLSSYDFTGKLQPLGDANGKTYNYTIRQVIDNTQLFFALRNINFATDDGYTQIPTVSPAYGQSKVLDVKIESEETFDIKYNLATGLPLPQDQTNSIAVNKISFVLSGSSNIGTKKYIKIQKKDTNSQLPFNALPVEYAESLIDLNKLNYGALKYTLKKCSIN